MNKPTWFFAVLFMVALVLWQLSPSDTQQLTETREINKPNFIAEQLYSVSFGEQGRPRYRIYAEQMAYFEQLKHTTFSQPKILVYPDPKQPVWQIVADQATVQQQHTVMLNDNVVIKNLSRSKYVRDLITDSLEIDLQNETMHSDKLVTVYGPSYELYGRGMNGDLANEIVTLLNDIEAVYHNPQE
ncbi:MULTISPECIES: LPS export ABC transporter periplasmic protein LptC [unclassified Agarivorans]|uniref:LPS export ABC transporter periplasmic protein LptC n=1 Tax=unclassified Agarivorans TaxID=2636026 RepID=UPI003D7D9B83